MTAIGIDLGTTYSCVGVYREGKVKILENERGNCITPSYVSFAKEERLYGEEAKEYGARNPTNTLYDIKRLIGRKYDDPTIQEDLQRWPFTVVNVDGKPKIEVQYKSGTKQFDPEEISAMILSKMKYYAERYLKCTVQNAVITVPAHFNDSQRQATIDAGKIAGLNVMKILNEPTAAAIAYGLDKHEGGDKNILVYDFGGGTLDVTILNIGDDKIFDIKATSGNTHLGGTDFDNEMAKHAIHVAEEKYGVDPSSSPRDLYLLLQECEKAKCALSNTHEFTIVLNHFCGIQEFTVSINRAKFGALCSHLFEKCLEPVDQALKDAKLNEDDIDDIILVGGSTRIPLLNHLLSKKFNWKELTQNINADEAVAHGAAIQAALLAGSTDCNIKDITLLDVTSLSLGVRSDDDDMSVIIERNTYIPCSVSKMYTNKHDYLDEVRVMVYEGENAIASQNEELGSFILHGIEKTRAGYARIEVNFDLDENGILKVSAVDNRTGSSDEIKISMDKGRLSEEEIKEKSSSREKYEKDDEEKRTRNEIRNDFETFLYNAKDLSSTNTEDLSIADRIKLRMHIKNAIDWLEFNESASVETLKTVVNQYKEDISKYLDKLH